MPVGSLDHVNIRTNNLKELTPFYAKVHDLKKEKRLAFKFGGAWLYCGNRATLHLVEVKKSGKGRECVAGTLHF
jgi:hypothetical protein